MNWYSYYLVGFAALFLAVNGGLIVQHEAAHEQINEYHGCLSQKTELLKITPGVTCLEWAEDADIAGAYEQHGINEIVGYHTLVVVLAGFSVSFLGVSALYLRGGGS